MVNLVQSAGVLKAKDDSCSASAGAEAVQAQWKRLHARYTEPMRQRFAVTLCFCEPYAKPNCRGKRSYGLLCDWPVKANTSCPADRVASSLLALPLFPLCVRSHKPRGLSAIHVIRRPHQH